MYKKIILIILIIVIVITISLFVKNNKSKLHIITIIDNINSPNYIRLLNSVDINKLNMTTLIIKSDDFRAKLKMLRNFISKIPNNDIIVYVDGNTSLVIGNEIEILEKYKNIISNFNNDIAVFASECLATVNLQEQIQNKSYSSLNPGAYISSCKQLKKILDILPDENVDITEQIFFTDIYLNKNLITLDDSNILFNSLSNCVDKLELHNKKWYNKKTESYPIIFNGATKESKNFLFTNIYTTI